MMAYNSALDLKIQALVNKDHMLRKTMFGGTCYLLKNKMVCGVWKDYIILRLGELQATAALKEGRAKIFDITGKSMKGWVMINNRALTPKNMAIWINKAKSFVVSLK
jgi:hypothetical protein